MDEKRDRLGELYIIIIILQRGVAILQYVILAYFTRVMDTYKGRLLVCSGIAGLIGGGLLLWRWWEKRTSYNHYEQEECVDQYMAFHYTSPSDYIAFSFGPKDALDFPARCVELCKKHKSVSSFIIL